MVVRISHSDLLLLAVNRIRKFPWLRLKSADPSSSSGQQTHSFARQSQWRLGHLTFRDDDLLALGEPRGGL